MPALADFRSFALAFCRGSALLLPMLAATSLAIADETNRKPDAKPKSADAKTSTGKASAASKTGNNKNSSEKKPPAASRPANAKPGSEGALAEPLSPKREAAAMRFAQEHHLELSELLQRLKASHPEEFSKAVRELDRTRERLEKQRERDADRFAIALREWQLDSRVRLLAARMTMGGSVELEAELRQVLLERHDVRLQLLTYDREKSKTRLQKVDEQIAEHVQNRESSVDRELDRIKKNAEFRKKSVAKPTNKRATGNSEKPNVREK